MSLLTQEKFLREVAGHGMTIIRDDGVHRHVRFKRPDTICAHFDLVTWPGYLCYSGDMGTFVFSRLNDMFEFFRRSHKENLFAIDHHYWAEKVEAGDQRSRGDGVREFSKAKFDAGVRQWVEEFAKTELEEAIELGEVELCTTAMNDLRAAVEREVIGADDNDVRSYDAANEFLFGAADSEAWSTLYGAEKTFEFVDFWECDHQVFTHRFQWCCFALAWAIKQYDDAKAAAAALVPTATEEVPA